MKIKDQDAWNVFVKANTDDYGQVVIRYAERWADAMEVQMSRGKALKDVAKSTSFDVDIDGISGSMLGIVAFLLERTWEYGQQLQEWYDAL